MTSRSVPEWIAKHADQKVPASVRLRIFRNAGGVCYLSGRKIAIGEAWELEHVKPLSMGGEHRETNLQPALIAPHRDKSKREAGARAKADASAKSALGIRAQPSRPMQGRQFTQSEKAAARKANASTKLPLPGARQMYRSE